jgi:hypothetical protein
MQVELKTDVWNSWLCSNDDANIRKRGAVRRPFFINSIGARFSLKYVDVPFSTHILEHLRPDRNTHFTQMRGPQYVHIGS